jgi:transposase
MKIIEILRLSEQGFTQRQIARSVKCAKSTVGIIQKKCRETGFTYSRAAETTDEDIIKALYPEGPGGRPEKDGVDFETVQKLLEKRPRINLMYAWEEYRMNNPDGLGYSQFCYRYRKWRNASGKEVVMLQDREAGKELFVDWMGDTLSCVVDSETGKTLKAHFFVAALGDSGYPVAEAFPDEKMDSWLTAHIHTFSRLGGLPRIVVPDNCRTAVYKPNYYDPGINRSYQDLASYYQVAIIPARIRSPRDKAPVESTVGWLETWLVQWLKTEGPYGSFAELNRAIGRRMADLVKRPFQKRAGTRESVFLALDKPALRPLPPSPYEIAEYQTRRVPDNYHLEYSGFYYSVPFEYYKQEVTLRITHSMIEVYDGRCRRIAVHERHYTGKRYVTVRNHMPANHQFQLDRNRFDGNRYRSWAASIGEHTCALIGALLSGAEIEETAYRSCMGILQCGKRYGNERLEAACKRARELNSHSYSTVYNILKNHQEQTIQMELIKPTPLHENVRGAVSFM